MDHIADSTVVAQGTVLRCVCGGKSTTVGPLLLQNYFQMLVEDCVIISIYVWM